LKSPKIGPKIIIWYTTEILLVIRKKLLFNKCIFLMMVARTYRMTLLQHTATHCNTLQQTTTHCNTLQHTKQTARHPRYIACSVLAKTHRVPALQHTASHCNTLQHTATHCNTLSNHTSNTLQHTATSQTTTHPFYGSCLGLAKTHRMLFLQHVATQYNMM